uniref:Uncharacterized protein n=1 Tax=Romanomermis culicivorax TaxID=13658 RepID=A0A915I667_ROMCU
MHDTPLCKIVQHGKKYKVLAGSTNWGTDLMGARKFRHFSQIENIWEDDAKLRGQHSTMESGYLLCKVAIEFLMIENPSIPKIPFGEFRRSNKC